MSKPDENKGNTEIGMGNINHSKAEIVGRDKITTNYYYLSSSQREEPSKKLTPELQPDSTPINRKELEDVFRKEYRLDKLDYGQLGTTTCGLEHKLELQGVYVALKVKLRVFDKLMASAKIKELTPHQHKNLPLLFQQIDESVRLEQEKNQRLFETAEKMDEQLSQSITHKILTEANAQNIRDARLIINEINHSHPDKHQQVMPILQALSNLAVIPCPLADIPGKSRFHLLIGNAGAGKSTVCRYIALKCFEDNLQEFNITNTLSSGNGSTNLFGGKGTQQVEASGFLPIYLRLEDFRTDYPDGLDCLLDCAANFWRRENKPELFHPGQLKYALEHQPVWLFLDGMDEIPNPAHRVKLIEIVRDISQSNSFPQLRITLTSRPAAITNELLRILDVPYFYILDLEQPQIEDFAHKYFVANLPEETREQVEKRAQEFLAELNTVPAASRMAGNPLLLTVIAVLHYKEGKLPKYRAELYEKCIEQLMAQKAKTQGRLETGNISFKYPSLSIDWNHNQIIDILRNLAFYSHQRTEDEIFLTPELLCRQFQGNDLISSAQKSSAELEQASKKFLDECDRLIGLLAFRGGHYVFVHRTFQEYLAAHWLSIQPDAVKKEQILSMLKNPAHWQEVIRLFFNRLGNIYPEFGKGLVDDIHKFALLQKDKLLIVLSAQCLVDFEDYQQRPTLHNKVKESLQVFRDNNYAQPELFLASGDALGLMDEPQIDVANPPMVYFPGGEPFNMGSTENEREKPIHPVTLSPYWLGKYPVTNKEFGEFIKAGGYENEEYWFDEESRFRFDGRKFLKGLKEKAPRLWLDERFGKSRLLAPVVGISWYEAMAYCRWWTLTYGKEKVIMRLPTEAEWEFAARGSISRKYPWGNTPKPGPELANYDDSKLKRTSAVGSYPKGATPEGVWDMAGNVLEWCYDWYGENYYKQSPDKNPIGPNEGETRVLRGGSWGYYLLWLRGAGRYGGDPGYGDGYIGFRCARVYS